MRFPKCSPCHVFIAVLTVSSFASGAAAVPLRDQSSEHDHIQFRDMSMKRDWEEIRQWNSRMSLNQPWIAYDRKCLGYGQNDRFFDTDLTGLRIEPLSHQPQQLGKFNSGIYKILLPSTTGSSDETESDAEESSTHSTDPHHIIKLVDLTKPYASCEPFALLAHQIWFQTGFMAHDSEDGKVVKWGAIQMEEVPGQPLHRFRVWQNAAVAEQKRVLLETRDKLFGIVTAYCRKSHGLLHTDFHANNVHVKLSIKNKVITVDAVYLLDFGYPGIYETTHIPPDAEFRTWFNLRFDLLWDYAYKDLGEEPPYYMKYVTLVDGKVVEVKGPEMKGKEAEVKGFKTGSDNKRKRPLKSPGKIRKKQHTGA
ncbi:hypothetical protein DFH05DRAFT_197322 [Lentinula detonsa]|uniref:Aminoglycoside phosphotransferase domain-containing protein n=1 Tax=Lentinula detonsa TaxID=2804962 RepID=A0A9W8PD40_9AGAR|nr:hypothetical protein DFH05DRAFT_197322 [Lentinula detonsa]